MKKDKKFFKISLLSLLICTSCAEKILDYAGLYGEEIENTIISIEENFLDESSINYIFLTDIHADSYSQIDVAKEYVSAAVELLNSSDKLDFICIGGDITYGEMESRKELFSKFSQILSPLKQSNKPVLIVNGNHDDNAGQIDDEEYVSKKDWNGYVSSFMPKNLVYCNEDNCSAFYYDLSKENKNFRIFCLDSAGGETSNGGSYWGYTEQETVWLSEKINECENVVFLSHIGPSYKYNCYNNDPQFSEELMNILITNKEKILSFSFGHTHCELLYCEDSIKYTCTASATSPGSLDVISDRSLPWQTVSKHSKTSQQCHFDVFSASQDVLIRIGFGAYNQKISYLRNTD